MILHPTRRIVNAQHSETLSPLKEIRRLIACSRHNLRETVRNLATSDSDLNNRLQNSVAIILQMKDRDFPDLGPIDIDPNDDIPHGSEIFVEFEPSPVNPDNLVVVDENGEQLVVQKAVFDDRPVPPTTSKPEVSWSVLMISSSIESVGIQHN